MAKMASSSSSSKRRVGIVGYGPLGQYLAHAILTEASVSEQLELAFVWNRTIAKVTDDKVIPGECVLEKLEDFAGRGADLIVEVAHPMITLNFGPKFLQHADYMVGSPTCFSNQATEDAIREAVRSNGGNHGCYIPRYCIDDALTRPRLYSFKIWQSVTRVLAGYSWL